MAKSKFPEEFKLEVVKQVNEGGYSVTGLQNLETPVYTGLGVGNL